MEETTGIQSPQPFLKNFFTVFILQIASQKQNNSLTLISYIKSSLMTNRLTWALGFLISFSGNSLFAQNEFITTWKTNNSGSSGSTEITIPASGTGINYDVDWDNDGTFDEFGLTGNVTHDFGIAGTYTIRIQGNIPRIYFNNSGDRLKLISIDQWGTQQWANMNYAYAGCSNLVINATDAPDLSQITTLNFAFSGTAITGNVSNWDVATITSFAYVFNGASNFNGDVTGWDMTNALSLSGMFNSASSFNQDISGWNTTGVTNMSSMFRDASSFDQNLDDWDVSDVTNASDMFRNITLSTLNYDSTLMGWSAQTLQTGVNFNGGNSQFCNATVERSSIISNGGWTISDGGSACSGQEYIITVQTDNPGNSGATEFEIPTDGSGYNYSVDWDNDGIFDEFGLTGDITHDFGTAGTYTIRILGDFPKIYFDNGNDGDKLLSVDQWGSQQWTDFDYSYAGCSNMLILASDTPDLTQCNSMNFAFSAAGLTGNVSGWDVSNIDFFAYTFANTPNFNEDISGWDVSDASTLSGMFNNAASFNQDISGWDVSGVSNVSSMFRDADAFDQNLGDWDMGAVTNASDMFRNITLSTSNYDSTLIGWNAQNLQPGVNFSGGNSNYCLAELARTNMETTDSWVITDGGASCAGMEFIMTIQTDNTGTSSSTAFTIPTDGTGTGYNYNVDWESDGTFDDFGLTGDVTHDYGTAGTYTLRIVGDFPRIYFDNGGDRRKVLDISQWGTQRWTSMSRAFYGCENMTISATDAPDLSLATSMARGFRNCNSLIGTNMASWDVSTITSFQRAFESCDIFDGPIGSWNMINAIDISRMFIYCDMFDQPLNNWNVSNIEGFHYAFYSCDNFNQDLDLWNTISATNMSNMFSYCDNFNGDVTTWNTSSVSNMSNMFISNFSFDQDLSAWDVSALSNASGMFNNVTLSTANYDALLMGWNAQTLQSDVIFSGGNSQYCAAEDARNTMSTIDTWIITDGGIDDNIAPTPDVANLPDVTDVCDVTSLVAPTATDNCVATVTVTSDAVFPITEGTTVVTWTYDDGRGNTSTQTQNVIVDDITAPTPDAASLSDILASCEVTSLTPPTGTDECAAVVTVTNDATLPISTQGTTVVTWIYDDGHGNTTTQTQNVILTDVTAPVADVATLATINAECEVTTLTAPTATDVCAGTVTATSNATLPISTLGTTTITWTYDDGNGNTATQTQDVVITDGSAPVADIATLPAINEECEVTSLIPPTATDVCVGTVTATTNASLPISTPGTTTITWTYDDGNGNTSTQTQNIVIADVTAPVADIATLPDVVAECEITTLIPPTATDNCSGIVTATSNASLPISAQGTTTITWTYDDGNGNTSTQTQDVVISDVTAPVADVATLPDVNDLCEVASITAPTATDNCSGTVTATTTTNFPITASTVVTWTYDDGNGNTATQTQNVTIDGVDISTSLNANGVTISANNTNATAYQWINCSNGNTMIPNATSIDFTPIVNGDYAVIITEGSCIDTSACVTVSTVSLDELSVAHLIIYPNPSTSGNFTVKSSEAIASVQLFDVLGRQITVDFDTNTGFIQGNALQTGKYILRVNMENTQVITKEISVIR